MSCSAPTGGSADMYGGKKSRRKSHYRERMGASAVLGTAILGAPVLGGRSITRRAHWRYIRGMKIRVPAKKVRDMGAPGKWAEKHGPGIGELKPGGLMGYSPSQSKTARHTKLRKAVRSKGALSTFRKLNALSTYTKRTAKSKSRTAKADRNWVKKTYM
jgi:hypothetical protein